MNNEIMVLPQAVDVEMSIIGEIIVDPSCVATVINLIDTDIFYNNKNAIIFTAIKNLFTKNINIDTISIEEELVRMGKFENSGGMLYVSDCVARMVSSANVSQHCRMIIEKYITRKTIELMEQIKYKSYSNEKTAQEVIENIEIETLKLRNRFNIKSEILGMQEMSNNLIDRIQFYKQNMGKTIGIGSGYHCLDFIIKGFEDGQMVIMAGRPGMGKTCFEINLARNISKTGRIVGVISLESTPIKFMERFLCQYSKLNNYNIMSGNFNDSEVMAKISELLAFYKIYIADVPGINLLELRSMATNLKNKHNIDILFIDYLQLIKGQGENRNVIVTNISATIKSLALELKIPIIALSQLSRQLASREDKRPVLSDLRDSGALEQDADMIMFIHRENYFRLGNKKFVNPESGKPENVEIIIAKNRDGRTGNVDMKYYEEWGLIEEYVSNEEREHFINVGKSNDKYKDLGF